MADLSAVLASLGDSGARIFQAVVDAVGTGVVTIRANGGTFTDVPYMQAGFYPAAGPLIGDPCYVIAQENWGLLCLGKPAPGPDRDPSTGGTVFWEPFTMAKHVFIGSTWTVSGSGDVSTDLGSAAAFFFSTSSLTGMAGSGLATASFFLDSADFDSGEVAMDWNYLEVGLHANATPAGTLQKVADMKQTVKVGRGFSQYVNIPLEWATRLIAGTAKGIYVQPEDYAATVSGPGTVRITEL